MKVDVGLNVGSTSGMDGWELNHLSKLFYNLGFYDQITQINLLYALTVWPTATTKLAGTPMQYRRNVDCSFREKMHATGTREGARARRQRCKLTVSSEIRGVITV